MDWAFKADGLFAIIWIMLATIALSTILERERVLPADQVLDD